MSPLESESRMAAQLAPFITTESTPYFYAVRLAAFVLIAFAVIDKNRRG